MAVNTANIVIAYAARSFDFEYTYLVPERLDGMVHAGSRVAVPFGRTDKAGEGYVLSIAPASGIDQSSSKFKYINDVLDPWPVLDSSMISLCRWMKDRYICTFSDAIRTMLPPGTGMKSIRKAEITEEGLHRDLSGLDAGSKCLMAFLKENGNSSETESLKTIPELKNPAVLLRKLKDSGLINITESYSSGVREKTTRTVFLALPAEEIADALEQGHFTNIRHIRILELLLENGPAPVQEIVRMAGISPGVLNTLAKHGYIDFRDIEVVRDPVRKHIQEETKPMKLTDRQRYITDSLKEDLTSGNFSEALIHGVTGSGKTEIYLQLISHAAEKGRQAIVLVPEIALTPQMTDRFKNRFGDRVAVIHSRMSIGERYDQWRLVREGRMIAAIGARSAVFAPFPNLGLIVVDEEHETSYKSEITPKYHASEIARQRCMMAGLLLIYGSATPSVKTYSRAVSGEIKLYTMDKRPFGVTMPAVSLVDMRRELESGNRSMFSRKLAEEIDGNIKNGRQTILFLNRRGYSSFVLCRSCGHVIKCGSCSISMTYHSSGDRLICHYCGYTLKNPKKCPACSSMQIRHFGTGTQRVEEELKEHFPGCSIIRMDADTTSGRHSHEDLLRAFRDRKADILLGTQMVAKGHDFPGVTLAGVLAADTLLNVGDYNAAERTYQLITQVSGRAGRSAEAGRVVIQTYNTEAYSIIAAVNNDYEGFYNKEILIRKELGYPPFTAISTIVISSTDDRLAYDEAVRWKRYLNEAVNSAAADAAAVNNAAEEPAAAAISVIGPSRAPISRMKDQYRWRIVLKTPTEEIAAGLLRKMTDEFRLCRKKNKKAAVYLTTDIDPASLV